MRPLLVVLSAAVIAGLSVFFAFSGSMAAMQGSLLMRLDVFVFFVAALAMVASALALAFRALLVRSDERGLQGLRDRIARLEAGPGVAATSAPSAPPAPPASTPSAAAP